MTLPSASTVAMSPGDTQRSPSGSVTKVRGRLLGIVPVAERQPPAARQHARPCSEPGAMRRRSSSSTAVMASIENAQLPVGVARPGSCPGGPPPTRRSVDDQRAAGASRAAAPSRRPRRARPPTRSRAATTVSYDAPVARSASASGRAIASPTIESDVHALAARRATRSRARRAAALGASTTLPPPCRPMSAAQCAVPCMSGATGSVVGGVRARDRVRAQLLGRRDVGRRPGCRPAGPRRTRPRGATSRPSACPSCRRCR